MKLKDCDDERIYVSELNESYYTTTPLLVIDDLYIGVNEQPIPYFNIYRIDEDDDITGICRIRVTEPKYITGYNENMVLSEEEKYKFCEKLKEYRTTDRKTNKEKSNWDVLVESFTKSFGRNFDNIFVGMPITDYTKLQ